MGLENNFKLEYSQSQQLKLNSNLMQSIKILSMPLQELNEYALQTAYDNPLLSINNNYEDDGIEPAEREAAADDALNPQSAEYSISENIIDYHSRNNSSYHYETAGAQQSFTAMLEEQIQTQPLDNSTKELCLYIIYCLNRKGYLNIPTKELAYELNCSEALILNALNTVQNLVPVGAGAQSFQEYLLLQLKSSAREAEENARKIIQAHLPLLAENNISAICRALGIDKEAALSAINIIRQLSPFPSQGYYTGEMNLDIVPDVIIKNENSEFSVAVNRHFYPKMELNGYYTALMKNTDDKKVRHYLHANYNSAKSFINAVDFRKNTLTRIIEYVILHQFDYLSGGKALKPMSMLEAAESLDLNTSTISRAIGSKYVYCNGHTFALRSLFTTGVHNRQGELLSSASVLDALKKLVAAEDKAHPLSDAKLCAELSRQNINVARRTIAKYRQQLNIPPASKRRAF